MTTAIQLRDDDCIKTETIPESTKHAFVFDNKVVEPKDAALAVRASHYMTVSEQILYVLREATFKSKTGQPYEVPLELVQHAEFLGALDIVKCGSNSEAFLRAKTPTVLGGRVPIAEKLDAVHMIKLQHNTLVAIKKALLAGTVYNTADFSDGSMQVIEDYFKLLGDDAPMEKDDVVDIEEDAAWRITPIVDDQFDANFSASEFFGLAERKKTKAMAPPSKKRQRDLDDAEKDAKLARMEERLNFYDRIFCHLQEIEGTSSVLAVTSFEEASVEKVDGKAVLFLKNAVEA